MAGVTPSGAAMSAAMFVERLDLTDVVGDVEIPCEAREHESLPGDEPAEWVVWQVQCCADVKRTGLVCDPCLQRALQKNNGRLCSFCGFRIVPYRHSITAFERINKTPGRHPGGPA